MKRSLAELAEALGIQPRAEWQRVEISGICEDSRCIYPNYLFVAIKGYVDDGHRYIDEALARGASGVIVEEREEALTHSCTVPCISVNDTRSALAQLSAAFWGHPTKDLFTVGVTGTNGKTTVCHLMAHLLGEQKTALVSTVANEERNLRAVTTPSSPVIQGIAYDAVAAGQQHFVVEVSSVALVLHRVDAVDFDVAVFTNLTHDHLDFHADRESYLKAKLLLFRGLKPESWAIVNGDDSAAKQFAGATQGKTFSYAVCRDADLRATDVRYQLQETTFLLCFEGEEVPIKLHLPGEHNVYNALAAASVGFLNGLSLVGVAERLASAQCVEGRYQFFRARNGATVIVDFAHSPDPLERMLRSLRPYYKRIISVFGCNGESDREKRPLMGAISGQLADLTILTTDNPKTEVPDRIIDEIEAGLKPTGGRYERIVDRREAIRRAVRLAQSGDAVLLAGKGHETYQIVDHNFVPYSDVGFLREQRLVSD